MTPEGISKALAIYDQAAKHQRLFKAFDRLPFQRVMEQQAKREKMVATGLQPSTMQTYIDIGKKMESALGTAEMPTLTKFLVGDQSALAGAISPSFSDTINNVTKDFAKFNVGGDLTTLGVAADFSKIFSPTLMEQLASQQRMFEGLFRGPEMLRVLASMPTIPTGFVEGAAAYRDELVEELTEVADVAPDAAEGLVSNLAEQRGAILKSVARLYGAAEGFVHFDIKLPNLLLSLMVWFWVIGEVADEILTEREDASGED
jgi:hypothetical protein